MLFDSWKSSGHQISIKHAKSVCIMLGSHLNRVRTPLAVGSHPGTRWTVGSCTMPSPFLWAMRNTSVDRMKCGPRGWARAEHTWASACWAARLRVPGPAVDMVWVFCGVYGLDGLLSGQIEAPNPAQVIVNLLCNCPQNCIRSLICALTFFLKNDPWVVKRE